MIYLDNNATSFIRKDIAQKMHDIMLMPYNASATHFFGREAKAHIAKAKRVILASLGVENYHDYRLIFTSGGSEANNLVINSFSEQLIITSAIEHLSILLPAKNIKDHIMIDIDANGLVKMDQLEHALATCSSKQKIVSIMMANNETGVIQNIKKITMLAHKYQAIVHSDMVQAYGKLEINLLDLGVDIITISAHKIRGPIGIGCVICKKNITLKPMILGGGQEQNMRAGTENIAAIIGFSMVSADIKNYIAQINQLAFLRNYLEEALIAYAEILSQQTTRLANTSCIIMPNVKNETQLMHFDLNNIAISAGSACSSGKISESHVVSAYGYNNHLASSAIRVSLGNNNNKNDINSFINCWLDLYHRLGEKKDAA